MTRSELRHAEDEDLKELMQLVARLSVLNRVEQHLAELHTVLSTEMECD